MTMSNIPSQSNYKPGGNVIGSTHGINARTKKKGKDEYGRWVWIEMQGKRKPVTIIQMYIPCKNTKGLNTVYQQQYDQLQQTKGIPNPNVRTKYMQDLKSYYNRNRILR